MFILNPAILKLLNLTCSNFESERILYTTVFSEYLYSYSLGNFKINQSTSDMLLFFFIFSFFLLKLILKHAHSLILTNIN